MTRRYQHGLAWGGALALIAACVALGGWQLQRMQAKQRLLDLAASLPVRPQPLARALTRPAPLAWVAGRGHWLPPRVLLDNQSHGGRAGLRLYQLLELDDGAARVLVDLGWLPWPGERRLPPMARLAGPVQVRGLLTAPPAAGLALGPALLPAGPPATWLATRIEPAAIAQALRLRDISPQVLRLDPALPIGHQRDLLLLSGTLPPLRHLGYAVQWFALALTVLVAALTLEWRRRSPPSGRAGRGHEKIPR